MESQAIRDTELIVLQKMNNACMHARRRRRLTNTAAQPVGSCRISICSKVVLQPTKACNHRMQVLTVRASSLGVEEEDALVHDTTNGSSSRHKPTGQSS